MVNTDRNTHEHVLRSFSNLSIESKEIRAFKGLETKIVVIEISVVIDVIVQNLSVGHDDIIDFSGNQWSMFL